MKIFNFFGKKQNLNKIENLPDLIRKINRNELINYINLYYKELPSIKKYFIIPLKKVICSKLPFSIQILRFEKEIYRPNSDFREMYFGTQPENHKIT